MLKSLYLLPVSYVLKPIAKWICQVSTLLQVHSSRKGHSWQLFHWACVTRLKSSWNTETTYEKKDEERRARRRCHFWRHFASLFSWPFFLTSPSLSRREMSPLTRQNSAANKELFVSCWLALIASSKYEKVFIIAHPQGAKRNDSVQSKIGDPFFLNEVVIPGFTSDRQLNGPHQIEMRNHSPSHNSSKQTANCSLPKHRRKKVICVPKTRPKTAKCRGNEKRLLPIPFISFGSICIIKRVLQPLFSRPRHRRQITHCFVAANGE